MEFVCFLREKRWTNRNSSDIMMLDNCGVLSAARDTLLNLSHGSEK